MQIGEVADKERARGWWNDQYLHPHETSHTVGEVIRWFRDNNIEYVQSVPTMTLFEKYDPFISGVWNPEDSTPGFFARLLKQAAWIWSTHHEGGYWITFGRSKQK